MKYLGNRVEDIKIAYIGGGSRGWAWGLMSDLASATDICGKVDLYDIDFAAAQKNEIIGNKFNALENATAHWDYKAVPTIAEALTGANFVIISILPGTFDEMESDVHTPEKYGIYQSVGDSTGPGGIVRAMRTIPMYEEIAENIKTYAPDAWVISYTNPMTLCVKALYRVFPEIKAFGCCHEVYGTQDFLGEMIEKVYGVSDVKRSDIKVNPVGVNHFTWLTAAKWNEHDLFDCYPAFCAERIKNRENRVRTADNWFNRLFQSHELVKMELFQRFGYIAAAGDRHLAEFCPGNWYLASPERVDEMGFALTPVSWRKKDLQDRLDRSARLVSGEEAVKIDNTGEEGVHQIRALLGLTELVTNVNIPNMGQIPNLPMGAVVETNAVFNATGLRPVFAGNIPDSILPLIGRICTEQVMVDKGIATRDLDTIFNAFVNDPLVTCGAADARKMFDEMVEKTKKYLTMYSL